MDIIINVIACMIYDICKTSFLKISWIGNNTGSAITYDYIKSAVHRKIFYKDEKSQMLYDVIASYLQTTHVSNIINDYSLYKLSGDVGYSLMKIIAKEQGLKGYSTMKKDDLLANLK